MAFPWPLIAEAPLASGSIVEDMQLGLALAREGQAPRFCEAALVDSHFPSGTAAAQRQRTRWEHGHLGLIGHHALPLMRQALRRGDWGLLGLALDLAVPPLALLVLVTAALWCLAALAAWSLGGAGPWWYCSLLLALLSAAVLAAWVRWGRDVLSPLQLLGAPLYAVSKLAIYLRFWSRRQKDWVRTDRK